MKKRVRIYKAPDGEGKFINKTAQFLQKAQEGGMPNVAAMGYPGSGTQQIQQTDDNQLASAVLTAIGNDEPRETIIIKLVNTYGKDPMEAQQFVDQMYQYVEQQQQSEEDDAESEDDGTDSVTTGQDTIEEAEIEDVRQGPTGTEMSNEIVDEWDNSNDDDSQAASDIVMRYGGYPRAQDGMEVPIMMPDVSAYLPSNMGDYLGDAGNPYADIAWNTPTETEKEEAVFSDYTEPILPEEYKMGGTPSKKNYVNSVLKLVKKQMGGTSAAPADFGNDSDPTGANVRKKSLDSFLGSVKNQSAIALAKQQAEEQYDQMMQMQQYPMAQNGIEVNKSGMDIDPGFTTNPATGKPWTRGEWEAEKQKTEAANTERTKMDDWIRAQMAGNQNVPTPNPAAYGVNPYAGNPFAINPYGNGRQGLGMFTRGYKMPRGFGYGMPPITRMDVRRSGWFGRPKEYSIEFGQMSPMPGMGMPGIDPSFYGVGPRTIKYPAQRILIEDEAASVNQVAKEEVSNNTPDSKATTDAAKTDVTTTVSTSTEGTVASNTEPSKIQETVTTTENGKTDTAPVRSSVVKRNNSQKSVQKEPVKKAAPVYAKKYDRTNYLPSQQYDVNDLAMGPQGSRVKLDTFVDPASGKTMVLKNPFNYKPLTKPAAEQVKKQFNVPVKTPKRSFAPTASTAGQTLWQMGGSINDPFVDAYGNLQQFIGGGYEDFTQGDLDDMYSKDTANADFPMAQRGGVLETLFPANIMPRRYGNGYSQMRGVPYDPRTKMPMPNFMPGPGKYINKVDVTKSNWLTGAPKKYTVTYGETMIGPRNAPGLPNSGTNTPQTQMRQPERTAIPDDLSLRARMAINAGERKVARNDRKIARNPEYWNEEYETVNYPSNSSTPNAEAAVANEAVSTSPINTSGPSTYDPYERNFQDYMQQSLQIAPEIPEEERPEYRHRDPKYGNSSESYESYMDFYNSGLPTAPGMVKAPPVSREDFYKYRSGSAPEETIVSQEEEVVASPQTYGSQEEEFCYPGDACYTFPKQQYADNGLFQSLPVMLSQYSANNNKNWITGEGSNSQIDLSQLTADDVRAAVKAGRGRSGFGKYDDYENTDEFIDKWLAYQQENQRAYGNNDFNSLLDEEGHDRYTDWLNVTGTPGEGGANDIWTTQGLLRQKQSKQYGGTMNDPFMSNPLDRFIPRAQNGFQSPVSYANNPAVARVTETYYDKNNKPRDIDFTNIFADYANANVQDSSGGYEQETSVDYKAKKAPRAYDPEAMLNTVNAGVRGVTGILNRRGNRMSELKQNENLLADNLYASDPSKDRGDYDTNSGLYRLDEMGQKWNSRSKQYGGAIYQDGGMVEGDEVFMTEEEIQEFLANGGDLEFI
jgi:hypothetical protein